MVWSSRSDSCSLLLLRALQMEGELEFAPRDGTEVPMRSAARGSAGWHRDAERDAGVRTRRCGVRVL